MLIMDDFNYFPSVINSVQASIIHIFTGNASTSQIVIDIFKKGILYNQNRKLITKFKLSLKYFLDETTLKKLISSLFKIFTMSTANLENEQNMESSGFHESSNVNSTSFYSHFKLCYYHIFFLI